MKTDYVRLLTAARELKGWDGPAEVSAQLTLGGYRVSEQMMTNWKSRGLSQAAYQHASRIVGCHPHWLATGEGEMRDVRKPQLAHPEGTTSLLERYQSADAATRALIDLALADPRAPLPEGLSPSIRTLIDSVRTMLAEQLGSGRQGR